MRNFNFKEWAKATAIRALKTFAETMTGFVTIGLGVGQIDWLHALSVSAVATMACVLLACKGLPELDYIETLEDDIEVAD